MGGEYASYLHARRAGRGAWALEPGKEQAKSARGIELQVRGSTGQATGTTNKFSDVHLARRCLATPNFTCDGKNRAFIHPFNECTHLPSIISLSPPPWRNYNLHFKQRPGPSLDIQYLTPNPASSFRILSFAEHISPRHGYSSRFGPGTPTPRLQMRADHSGGVVRDKGA